MSSFLQLHWSWGTGAEEEDDWADLRLVFYSMSIMEEQRGKRVENLGKSMIKRETMGSSLKGDKKKPEGNSSRKKIEVLQK